MLAEEGELLFFQLPDVLPGDPPLRDDEPNAKSPRSKTKQDTKKVCAASSWFSLDYVYFMTVSVVIGATTDCATACGSSGLMKWPI